MRFGIKKYLFSVWVFMICLSLSQNLWADPLASKYRDLSRQENGGQPNCAGKLTPSAKFNNIGPHCLYRQEFNSSGALMAGSTVRIFALPGAYPNDIYDLEGDNNCSGPYNWSPPQAPRYVRFSYFPGNFALCTPSTPPAASEPAWAVLPPYGFSCQSPVNGTIECSFTNPQNYGELEIIAIPQDTNLQTLNLRSTTNFLHLSSGLGALEGQGPRSISFRRSDFPSVPTGQLPQLYTVFISGALGSQFPSTNHDAIIVDEWPAGNSASSGLVAADNGVIEILPDAVPDPVAVENFQQELIVENDTSDPLAGTIREFHVRLTWDIPVGAAGQYALIHVYEGQTQVGEPLAGNATDYLFENVSFRATPPGPVYGVQPVSPQGVSAPLSTTANLPFIPILPDPPLGISCNITDYLAFECTMNTYVYTGANAITDYVFEVSGPGAPSEAIISNSRTVQIQVSEPGNYTVGGYYLAGTGAPQFQSPDANSVAVNGVQEEPPPIVATPVLEFVAWERNLDPAIHDLELQLHPDQTFASAIARIEVRDEEGLLVASLNNPSQFTQLQTFEDYANVGKICFNVLGYNSNNVRITTYNPSLNCLQNDGQFFTLDMHNPTAESSIQNHTVFIRYNFNLPPDNDDPRTLILEFNGILEEIPQNPLSIQTTISKQLPANHSKDGRQEIKVYHELQAQNVVPQTLQSRRLGGHEFVGVVLGDINSDGSFTQNDIDLYSKYLFSAGGSEQLKCPDAMDFDGNGLVTWRLEGTRNLVFHECGRWSKMTYHSDLKEVAFRKCIAPVGGTCPQPNLPQSNRQAPPNFLSGLPIPSTPPACHYDRPPVEQLTTWTNTIIPTINRPCDHGPATQSTWRSLRYGSNPGNGGGGNNHNFDEHLYSFIRRLNDGLADPNDEKAFNEIILSNPGYGGPTGGGGGCGSNCYPEPKTKIQAIY